MLGAFVPRDVLTIGKPLVTDVAAVYTFTVDVLGSLWFVDILHVFAFL